MTAADRIRARIAEKREEYADYLRHLGIRLREEDLVEQPDNVRCTYLLNGVRCVRVVHRDYGSHMFAPDEEPPRP